MSWFYTNISYIDDKLYIKGYKDTGEDILGAVDFKPYLFVKGGGNYKSFDGNNNLFKKEFNSYKELSFFAKKNVCYGMGVGTDFCKKSDFIYTFIADTFKNQETVEYNFDFLKVLIWDIETSTEEGFPDHLNPIEEILSISTCILNRGKKIYKTFGIKHCDNDDVINYEFCKNEEELVVKFLNYIRENKIDVISGWYCLDINSSIWCKDKIKYLKDISNDEHLLDSNVNIIFPNTRKQKCEIHLSNGKIINCSKDHIFPISYLERGKYSNFSFSNKNKLINSDKTTYNISELLLNNEVFLKSQFDCNSNEDDINFTDDELYVMGMIYTDGNFYKKEKCVTVYNNNYEVITKVKDVFLKYKTQKRVSKGIYVDKRTNIFYTKCYVQNNSKIEEILSYIYYNNKKCLNIEKLSKLSKRQFLNFISGCIDGDGNVGKNNITIARKSFDERSKYQELLMWNGVYSTITTRGVGISIRQPKTNLKDYLNLLIDYKKKSLNNINFEYKNTSSNKVNFRFINDEIFIKVVKILQTNDVIEMKDISTDNHYFHVGGVKTHNCDRFDITYFCSRVEYKFDNNLLKLLSPFNIQPKKVNKKETNRKTGQLEEYYTYKIEGLTILDGHSLYRKYDTYNGSLTLENISLRELGKGKVNYDEYGSLKNLYKNDWNKFIYYNQVDVERVVDILDKTKYLEISISIAFISKSLFEDTLGTVKIIDNIVYNYLYNKNIIIPHHNDIKKEDSNIGGRVRSAKLGLSKYCVSLDATSLYPSLIVSLGISFENFVKKINIDNKGIIKFEYNTEFLKEGGLSLASNGCLFDKKQTSVMPVIIENVYNKRLHFKKLMKEEEFKHGDEILIKKYDGYQYSYKILMNSFYGVCGSDKFRYFNNDIANAITISGQTAIQIAENSVNKFLNEYLGTNGLDFIVMGDTDSLMIELKKVVEKENPSDPIKFIDDFHKEKLEPIIEKDIQKFLDYSNACKSFINFKREKIMSGVVNVSKKKYFAIVENNEGIAYNPPKIIEKGIETVQAKTPEPIKNALKDCLKIILQGSEKELQSYIKQFKNTYKSFDPYEIASSISVNGLDKYTDFEGNAILGTPAQVKAAIIYNKTLKELGLENELELIKNGDKVKMLLLRFPNKFHNDRIVFKDFLDKRLGIEPHIDYIRMLEDSFEKPLQRILDVIGWSMKPKNTF